MKKVVIALSVAALVLLLLFACLYGCVDRVPPVMADAEEVFTPSPGIVRPNLLDEYNFTSLVSVNSAPTDTSKLLSTTASYTLDSSGMVHFTSSGNLYFAFHTSSNTPFASALYLFCRYVAPSGSTISVSCTVHDLSGTYSDRSASFNLARVASANFSNISGPVAITITANSVGFFDTDVVVTIPVASDYYFWLFKYESYDTNGTSITAFTGIPVEGYSYSLPDVASQSVLCYPNLLNGSDFYELPYYGVPSLSATDESFYYTDIPTDAFYFDPNYSQFPYVENAVVFSTVDGSNGIVPNSKYIKYRYYYKDLMADEIGVAGFRYYLTYTLRAFITGDLVITIEDDLSNVVTETFVPDVNNSIYSVTLPASGAPSLFNYVDITVTFYAPDENSPVAATLRWSKLEATDRFTGYVPVSHTSPDLSAMNYINNYDFSYLGSSVVGDNYWFYEDGYGVITLQDDLKGWRIDYTSSPDFTLSYIFSGLDIPLGTTCTFSLYASTSSLPFDVKIYNYSEGVYTLSKSAHYTKSLASFVRSVVCTYSDHLKISLVFPYSGESDFFLLDYAKFEVGDTFTGFLPSNAGLLQEGIDTVTNYNDGVPVVGAYYAFNSSYYNNFTLTYGNTSVFDPSFTYYGASTTSWSSTLGLCIPSDGSGASLTTSTYHFNVNSSASAKYVFAFQFYSVNPVDVNFIFGTAGGSLSYSNINYLRTINSANGFVWFALDAPPDFVSITLVTPNSYLYLTKYKTEKSPFFTGFPNDDLDYNSAVVPQYSVGYASGYSVGFQEGSTSINNELYSSGYDSGYTDGYGTGRYTGESIGYQEGLSLAQNGTWRSLVSALIDVPVATIVSFLDFEILGFNMLNILRTVILLSLFFFLLNKMTGK